jgi:hypothetical protein
MSDRNNYPLKPVSPNKKQSSSKPIITVESPIDIASLEDLTSENVVVMHLRTQLSEAQSRMKIQSHFESCLE